MATSTPLTDVDPYQLKAVIDWYPALDPDRQRHLARLLSRCLDHEEVAPLPVATSGPGVSIVLYPWGMDERS